MLNFAVCSADFYLRKRIHDLVSITQTAFKDELMDFFFSTIFQEIISLFIVLCLFIHNIG